MSARQLARWGSDLALSALAPLFRRDLRLRILGYHDVKHGPAFKAQMRHLVRHYHPVGAAEVCAAVGGARRLPKRAVWVTFDDGDPSVVEVGAPILKALGVPATLFVCPGVIDTDRPLWFQAIRASRGRDAERLLTELKRLPATERAVRLSALVQGAVSVRQLTIDELRVFVEAGGTVANHTWDHPLLDQVAPEEVERQIVRAHTWLSRHFADHPLVFAFPNGNPSLPANQVLADLGYLAAVLFDHRVGGLEHAFSLSRVRVNSTDSAARFRAAVSGAHPALYALRGAL